MQIRRLALSTLGTAAVLTIVAGCTSDSDGDGTPSATVTATRTVSSAAPPTGSGVPASSTPPTSSGSSSGSASGPGLCTPTVMTFTVGKGEGAAGTGYFSIIATNASKQPCVTTGWPGIAILGDGDRQVAQAERTGPEGSTLTVQPGQEIHAVVSSSDVPNGQDASTCVPPSTAILFTLPDNTDSTRITGVSITQCDPKVQAFRAGATG